MWEKGEAIYTFTEGKSIKFGFWTELEKQTERDDQHLKRWYDIYKAYPEKEKAIEEEARPKAKEERSERPRADEAKAVADEASEL